MEMIANNPKMAKKVGVPQSVGKDFEAADKGKTFKKGGEIMATKKNPFMEMIAKKKEAAAKKPAKATTSDMGGMMKKGGSVKKMAMGGMAKDDTKKDKAIVKKAVGMHDKQQHSGKKTDLATLKKGGMTMKKMAGGGLSAGHKDADGIASKGKTKGTMVKMAKGGRYC